MQSMQFSTGIKAQIAICEKHPDESREICPVLARSRAVAGNGPAGMMRGHQFESFPILRASMYRTLYSAAIMLAVAAFAVAGITRAAVAAQDTQPVTLAIAAFDYADTSGEIGDATQAHAHLVETFTQSLARDLGETGKYRIVPLMCGQAPCTSKMDPVDLQKAAQVAGVKLVLLGGFHKMSTLVQWAKMQIIDVDAGNVTFDRLVTFRNDTGEAWKRAETFLFREIMAASSVRLETAPAAKIQLVAATQPQIKLALFNFELEDFSGGAGIVPESDDDRLQLKRATDDVRKLLVDSGRYSLVDVSGLDSAPVKAAELRKCNGCDAALARSLGADQSLLGIVTRITRTDYAVTFRLRDAKTGSVIDVEQTDLRIGANYSWNRGAVWLIQRKLLDKPQHS
jgi:hypothetical protein